MYRTACATLMHQGAFILSSAFACSYDLFPGAVYVRAFFMRLRSPVLGSPFLHCGRRCSALWVGSPAAVVLSASRPVGVGGVWCGAGPSRVLLVCVGRRVSFVGFLPV